MASCDIVLLLLRWSPVEKSKIFLQGISSFKENMIRQHFEHHA
ncbi:hypothetical protein SAMD00020551_1554 [Mesobacillus selenatarsenatis SF-1]|uniref:Uncharacterized protein n=1 Tax=Mesobacillus selenatarsenatis (strain DSM 18680 / JCM 14380 / FERM P-15431 / SF-1) TaxID=1321606 RepID=A0A0A8X0D3_MESS1|nr:hypothetical protein SAMD00020551_1554 [Mesobacillus selenatarsenatis SF-1]